MTAIAWDSSFNSSNFTLATVNATNDKATHSVTASRENIITATSFNSGKIYFEYLPASMGNNNSYGGICDSSFGITTVPSNTFNCVRNLTAFGYVNGGSSQHVEMAVDADNRYSWFRLNN